MEITLTSHKSILKLEFLLPYLKTAVKYMNLERGSLNYPIALDSFVLNTSDAIPELRIGVDHQINLELNYDASEDEEYKPMLHFCKGRDLTKSSIMSIIWSDIFNVNDLGSDREPKISLPPDGCLYLKSDDYKTCTIDLKTESPTLERFISYSAILSLNMEIDDEQKERLYFILDPLLKVSSNQGG